MAEAKRKNPIGAFYVALAAFALAMLACMGYVSYSSWVLSREHAPNVRAAGHVKLDATLAHLWFEEMMSGDRSIEIEVVWDLLDSARFYARAMLEGGADDHGTIVPLNDPELRDHIRQVDETLTSFQAITDLRLDAANSAAPGTRIDQQYDGVFAGLISQTDGVELRLHEVIRRDTNFVRRVQITAMAGAAVLAILVGVLFARYNRQRIQAEQALESQIRAEKEAREHLGNLAHVARLTTMNELAAGIAHEVNQPLTSIMAAAGASRRMADSGELGSGALREALELIESEAVRAGNVIRRLRTFVSKGTVNYQLSSINEIVETMVKLAQFDPQIRKQKLKLELADDLPPVEVDVVQIQQVLLNLLRNANEAMQDSDSENNLIVVTTREAPPGEVQVAITDHGIGIPPASHNKPFIPFMTTKQTGMGIGLAICESLITAHGGRIGYYQNDDERGTTFFFTLPAAPDEART